MRYQSIYGSPPPSPTTGLFFLGNNSSVIVLPLPYKWNKCVRVVGLLNFRKRAIIIVVYGRCNTSLPRVCLWSLSDQVFVCEFFLKNSFKFRLRVIFIIQTGVSKVRCTIIKFTTARSHGRAKTRWSIAYKVKQSFALLVRGWERPFGNSVWKWVNKYF